MDHELRQATPEEAEALHEIVRRCGVDLRERRLISFWDPPYPLQLFRRAAESGYVFGVYDGGVPVATFTLTDDPPGYYDMTVWAQPDAPAAYASRLAVQPELQGRGLGTWCMRALERVARERGARAVRFDAVDDRPELLTFYDGRGYERRAVLDLTFTDEDRRRFGARDTRVVCFERLLTDAN